MKIIRFPLLIGSLLFSVMEYAEAVTPDPIPCVRDLEVSFFESAIVSQALSLYQVPQSLWSRISLDLQNRGASVLSRMERKSANMVPNPIEYPLQKMPTAELLINTLHEVFLESMQLYQVNEQPNVDLIFNYILSQQGDRFVACFGPEVKAFIPQLH